MSRYYRDLREFVARLDKEGLLHRVQRPTDKDRHLWSRENDAEAEMAVRGENEKLAQKLKKSGKER